MHLQQQLADVHKPRRHLTLWSPTTNKGAQITYPTITVHAQVGAAVLLELNLSDSNVTPDEDIEHLQIRLTPTTIVTPTTSAGQSNGNGASARAADPSFALYMAIGDCQELNPDPAADDDSEEEGYGEQAFDETAPGATGWITSENIHEYTDADGNFKMPEGVTVFGDEGGDDVVQLGEGAGRVRRAGEFEDAEEGADADSKWQKTG
jgi:nucleotide-sensitive chloride channel 1A